MRRLVRHCRVLTLPCCVLAAVLAAGCASTGAVPRPFPTPGGRSRVGTPPPAVAVVPAPAVPLAPAGTSIADTAFGLQGIPYRLGGADPDGFDCSGLVQYVLARHGVAAPRVVKDQLEVGEPVRDALQPGDLVFFAVSSRRASHVGIALDGERFVHAPATGQAVRVDSLSSEYWSRRYAGARRVEAPATPPGAAPSPPAAATSLP